MKKQFFIFTTLLLLCCFSSFAQASTDVLKLKNGNTVRGTITKETYGDNAGVTIDLGNGNVMTLKTSEIEERSRETPKAVEASPVKSKEPENTSGEKKGSRGFFTAGFNFLAPIGMIANKNIDRMFTPSSSSTLEASQYATSGGSFALDGSFIFKNTFVGIGTSLQISAFGFDDKQVVLDGQNRGGSIVTSKGDVYGSVNILAGLAIAAPLNKERNLYFDFRALGGLTAITTQKVVLTSRNGSLLTYTYDGQAGAAIQSDLGLRLNISRLALRLALVYSNAATADRSYNIKSSTSSGTLNGTLSGTQLQGLGVGFHIGFTL